MHVLPCYYEWTQICHHNITKNKDEKVHRFSLSAIRGELLERKRERDKKIVLGYYTGYL